MSKLTNKKTIKNQVKNLIISILVASVLSIVIKQMPKQPAYQFNGEIIFFIVFVNSHKIFNEHNENNYREIFQKITLLD